MLKYFSGMPDGCWSRLWREDELGQPSVKLTGAGCRAVTCVERCTGTSVLILTVLATRLSRAEVTKLVTRLRLFECPGSFLTPSFTQVFSSTPLFVHIHFSCSCGLRVPAVLFALCCGCGHTEVWALFRLYSWAVLFGNLISFLIWVGVSTG